MAGVSPDSLLRNRKNSEENAKRERNMKTIPVRSPQRAQKRLKPNHSRVRILENRMRVRIIGIKGSLTISMRHEAVRDRV